MRTTLLIAAGLALALAPQALAHGGQFDPGNIPGAGTPSGGPPVGGGTGPGQPNPNNPNPVGGGVSSGGVGTGNTPNPGGGGAPVRPGVGGAPRRSGGRGFGGVTPGRKKSKDAPRYMDWDFWWDLNEERFLNLKRKVRTRAAHSENRDSFLGSSLDDGTVARVSMTQIKNRVLPALKVALKDSFYDTRAAAVIALGKVGGRAEMDVMQSIVDTLSDDDSRVRESACLGLGLLGNKAALPVLKAIIENSARGKEFCGREQKDILTRTRSFAAVAVGLIGRRDELAADDAALQTIVKTLTTRDAHVDLQLGPVIALQVAHIRHVIPDLIDVVQDPEQDAKVRAHVAVALGKAGVTSSVSVMNKLLTNKSAHVARSAAIALGLLVDPEDKRSVNSLIRHARSGADRGTRNFCIMALGEIGGAKARATLIQLATKGSGFDRSYGALALGVMSFKHKAERGVVGRALLDQWEKTRSDSERSAIAVALGLVNYDPAREPLRRLLDRPGSQTLKGHVCTALGLMEDRDALPLIQNLVKQKGDPELRKRAAIALGLLRDTQAVGMIQKIITESTASKAILGAATMALGFIGDRAALPTLIDFVENEGQQHQDVTRAFAAVALGHLGDKDEIPMLSLIHESANYLGPTPMLAELLTIL